MAKPLLPTAYVNFKDGQLPKGPRPSGLFVFIGVGDGSAEVGVPTPINSPNDIQALFGTGPLARDLTSSFLEGLSFAYGIQVAATTAGSIGAPVLSGFTAGALAGTVKNAYDVRIRVAVAGAPGVAQVQYSLDGGETWGSPQVLKAGANEVIGASAFKPGLTFSTTSTDIALTNTFSCVTVAPRASLDAIEDAMDVAIQDASLFFNGFHISNREDDTEDTVSFANSIVVKLLGAETTWYKYLYAVLQAPLSASTPAAALSFAQVLRADFASNRIQFASMPMVVKSLGGQFVMNTSPIVVARRAALAPQNDLGMLAAGQLKSIVKYATGWNDGSCVGIDQVKNTVTVRRHVGASGFYFTNDFMSDPTSDYRKSCLRLVADLVAADIRAAGLPFVKMDVDPSNPARSAEALLTACRSPLKSREIAGTISKFQLSVPDGQDILADEELIIEVAITPMGTASWIKFNLGFKSPFAGG